jgi:fumarate reductase subunit D
MSGHSQSALARSDHPTLHGLSAAGGEQSPPVQNPLIIAMTGISMPAQAADTDHYRITVPCGI